MSHKKPPQGTHSIHSPNREKRVQKAAEGILNGLVAYNKLKKHKLWEDLAQTIPDAEAWSELAKTFSKEEVLAAYKYWRMERNA